MDLLNELTETLKQDERLVSDGNLLKNKIIELGLKLDDNLISLLLGKDDLKKHFFKEINRILIFDKDKFMKFIDNKKFLPDSYTSFKNKIGLTTDKEYLSKKGEVVLSWPYKDCILEGGMEDIEEKNRQEIFWNEILAPDDIDRLFDPKIFTNFKRFDTSGENEIKEINTLDNLIIKGNNLLALHSLKRKFAKKVKLIYIDPPYNTGGSKETFTYNNNFNHSTWLTFMKNRLEIAKELLRDDGVIIIAIDDNEQSYLGVLIDELFINYEKHCITIVHNPRGVQGTNFSYIHEYAYFVLPKGKRSIGFKKLDQNEIYESNLRNWGGESLRIDARNCFYPIIIENDKIIEFGDIPDDNFHPKEQTIEINGKYYVWPIDSQGVERKWRYARQSIEQIKDLLIVKKTKKRYEIEIAKDFGMYKTVWIDKKYDANEYGTKLVKQLVPDSEFSYPKSLYNVYDCINSVVGEDKNAIILDFHSGSGTTGHAVLELNNEDGGNRKFILIEQLDEHIRVSKERILKVIKNLHKEKNLNNFDKTISFIYCELMKWNESYMDKIVKAENTENLLDIWNKMKTEAFLSYKIDPKLFDDNVEEFKDLSLENQKKFLIECLDKNQLYVNFSEIEDEEYNVADKDKQLNKQFYGVL